MKKMYKATLWSALLALVACGSEEPDLVESGRADAGAPQSAPPSSQPDAPAPVADAGSRSDAGLAPDAAAPESVLSRFLPGVNLAGADFGQNIPGVYGTDYRYPTHDDVDYFYDKGLRMLRVTFKWERLQRSLGAEFDPVELGRLDDLVGYALQKGAVVLLDPHNYARYGGKLIDSDVAGAPTRAHFADFWTRLAGHFRDESRVLFGVVNEPYGISPEAWLVINNAAIAAIRATGATQPIFVPGVAYSGAHSWISTRNGEVMLGVVDPLDNYVYDVHQYFDSDSSGTSRTCVSATIGVERLQKFTAWLIEHNKRGFLGEFGASVDPPCLPAIDNMLSYIDQHRDVWVGWTYWAGGSRWPTQEKYTVKVNEDGTPKLQLLELLKHL